MLHCLSYNQCSCVNKSAVFHHPLTGHNYPLKGHFTCLSKFVVYYPLKGHFTCLSKFVVYTLVCPCGLIYVGETMLQIKTRICQNRSTIRRSNTKLLVYKHYVEKGHLDSELKFMVLEDVRPLRHRGDCELLLRKREVWWIHKLNTLVPNGLNKDYDFYVFLEVMFSTVFLFLDYLLCYGKGSIDVATKGLI
ncbi:hypothetical protein XELAEV_18031374mg [Xenopus laevis]|uniref:GIY-YIG domain-containing protein n=1 Tax=Xenopus laevis TaxID=8355 RepID=A0A974CNN9_XENLA|nr:hypothetical protein XELAEV_18031374mg [Xenopus laevis]